MQAQGMQIHIVLLGGVVLYHRLILLEKHALNLAHFLPGRSYRAIPAGWGHRNMFPAAAVGCHNVEHFAAYWHPENSVASISIATVVFAFKFRIAVFVQGVQIFHFCHFQS